MFNCKLNLDLTVHIIILACKFMAFSSACSASPFQLVKNVVQECMHVSKVNLCHAYLKHSKNTQENLRAKMSKV